MDYWEDHAEIALSEAGLPPATKEQIEIIAGVIESAHEHYGQNMGHDVANVNLRAEQERQRKAEIAEIERQAEIEKSVVEKALKASREERERLEWAMHDLRRENARLKQYA